MSEKGELKPEVTPFFGAEMSCVIPPFSAKFRMRCMVGRELIGVSGQGATENVFGFLTIDDCRDIKK